MAGALGGMAGAGLVYALVNHGGPGAPGWGIPMATDIAFALGALALLGRRVPPGLRVFLLTLAVADDIGSVVVLAVFYSSRTSVLPLVAAAGVAVALVVARRLVRLTTGVVLAVGSVLWVLLAAGGVEPALAGVVAGLLVPSRPDVRGREPAEVLERRVAPWSAFVVLPLFALANAGITFHAGLLDAPGATAVFAGVAAARVLGKLVGITVACLVVVRTGLGRLPDAVRWRHLAGGAAVAGIGFTVPLLIAELAFPHRPRLVAAAELGLFAGSALAFAVGAVVLVRSGPGAGARCATGRRGTTDPAGDRPGRVGPYAARRAPSGARPRPSTPSPRGPILEEHEHDHRRRRHHPRRPGDDHRGGNPTHVQTADVLGTGKVVLFAVPGAFTPTCSDYHLPSYVIRHDDLGGQGRRHRGLHLGQRPVRHERLGRVAARRRRRHDAGGRQRRVRRRRRLEMDGSGFGLGTRSQRYAMVLEDGVVTALHVEPGARPHGQCGRRRARAPLDGRPAWN